MRTTHSVLLGVKEKKIPEEEEDGQWKNLTIAKAGISLSGGILSEFALYQLFLPIHG